MLLPVQKDSNSLAWAERKATHGLTLTSNKPQCKCEYRFLRWGLESDLFNMNKGRSSAFHPHPRKALKRDPNYETNPKCAIYCSITYLKLRFCFSPFWHCLFYINGFKNKYSRTEPQAHLKIPARPSPAGWFGRLLSTIVEVHPINTTVAFSTSPLILQGEKNKLEKESEDGNTVFVHPIRWTEVTSNTHHVSNVFFLWIWLQHFFIQEKTFTIFCSHLIIAGSLRPKVTKTFCSCRNDDSCQLWSNRVSCMTLL